VAQPNPISTSRRPSILHVLPHPGGGSERVLDVLARINRYEHARVGLSTWRSPLAAAPIVAVRTPRIARAARSHDVVHVIGDTSAIIITAILASRPSVFGSHGLSLLRRSSGLRLQAVRLALRRVLRNATHVVCSSRAEHDQLLELEPATSARMSVVPNGIDLPPPVSEPERRAAREHLALSEEELAVLYLGRLDVYKDPLTAVRAVEAVRQQEIPAVLLAAGDGPFADELQRRRGPGLRPLGFRGDIRQLFAAADIFVLPSWREGLSYALLEGMAHGVACIVSDGLGNPDAVGEAGLIAPAGDVGAFAEAMRSLALDPDERERLAVAGRRRIAERFSADAQAAAMEAIFDSVRQAGPAAAARGA
jgi:glycosyltransferase involved in cell wall biosynthesis